MTEKHYPYCGGSFDRIIFDKDGSVWVPETENAKLRELMKDALIYLSAWMGHGKPEWMVEKARELGIEVDA